MLLKIVHLLVRRVLGLAVLVFRGDLAKDAGSSPQALDRNLPGDASDAPGLAPQAGRQKVRHRQPAQARPTGDSPEHRVPPEYSIG